MDARTRTPYPYPDELEVGPTELDAEDHRSGLTPARFLFLLAVLAAAGVIAYGLLIDRGRTQIPFLVSGMAMMGLALIALALLGAASAVRAGRSGRTARAFAWALVGGFCALAAAGSLASAVVLALIWTSA